MISRTRVCWNLDLVREGRSMSCLPLSNIRQQRLWLPPISRMNIYGTIISENAEVKNEMRHLQTRPNIQRYGNGYAPARRLGDRHQGRPRGSLWKLRRVLPERIHHWKNPDDGRAGDEAGNRDRDPALRRVTEEEIQDGCPFTKMWTGETGERKGVRSLWLIRNYTERHGFGEVKSGKQYVRNWKRTEKVSDPFNFS